MDRGSKQVGLSADISLFPFLLMRGALALILIAQQGGVFISNLSSSDLPSEIGDGRLTRRSSGI